ncbi:MAG TPA: amidohydrolase family protein [Pyrinomonadaceae bacterium]
MVKIYSAAWVLPVTSTPIADGSVAVDGQVIVGVGTRAEIGTRFPDAQMEQFSEGIILPGLVNTHTHLELTAMRGYLEKEESDFFAWLKKLTLARMFRLTPDDLTISATWGACEAARAGITSVGDASDSAITSMRALKAVGLRGVVFQESFGPDARLLQQNVEKLKTKVNELTNEETDLVKAGVSPHAPYTVCAPQLEAIAEYATAQKLPVMMHAAESEAEDLLLREASGLFADNLKTRGIDFTSPRVSPIQHLRKTGILDCKPLLAHCIRVDDQDIDTIARSGSKVAHCPKSNAKLQHGRAPLAKFLDKNLTVGLGSDSVASNNTCDLLEEARFAVLLARAGESNRGKAIEAAEVLHAATVGGAKCLGLSDQVGQLKAGLKADLTVVSLNATHQLPVHDPLASIIFSSSGRDVVMTMVAGRELYRDGRVLGVDEERLKARILEISKKLV